MSVINQMLKDLDKRQQQQTNDAANHVPVIPERSLVKPIAIIVIVFVLINISAIYFWQLYQENQSLKAAVTKPQSLKVAKESVVSTEKKLANGKFDQQALIAPIESAKNITAEQGNNQQAIDKEVVAVKQVSSQRPNALPQEPSLEKELVVQQVEEREKIAPTKAIEKANHDEQVPTLSISRKQLSPEQLAQKRMAQAEQALESNQITKAEKLLEEVLLVVPQHKQARKKLAALWFGRQSFQAAHNLLSQGISLDSQDLEFRIMKARIYLTQEQLKKAFELLGQQQQVLDVEYQALLANIAQQLNEFESAEHAYQRLTVMEPSVGRWWLGLAIVHDSQSQFIKAVSAYRQALAQSDLSASTIEFASNRIKELGE